MALYSAIFIILCILICTTFGTEPKFFYDDGCTKNISINQTVFQKHLTLDLDHHDKKYHKDGWTYRIELDFHKQTRDFAQAQWSHYIDDLSGIWSDPPVMWQCWVAIFQTFHQEITEDHPGRTQYHHQILRIIWIFPIPHPPYIYFHWRTYHHDYLAIKANDIEPNSYYLFRKVPAYLRVPKWRFWLPHDMEFEMRLKCERRHCLRPLIKPEVFLGNCHHRSKRLTLLRCELLPHIFHCNSNYVKQCAGHDWYKFPVNMTSPVTSYPVQKFQRDSPEIPLNIPIPLPIPVPPKSINFNFFENRKVGTAIMAYSVIIMVIAAFMFAWVRTWK